MNNEELLNLYLEKLRLICLEKLDEKDISVKDISVMDALKESLLFLEGEMTGY